MANLEAISPLLPVRRPHARIVVVGTTGSGKSTYARQIGQHMAIPHVELDALHWDPGWTAVEKEEFRRRVLCVVSGEKWVVDGTYSVVRDIVWSRATMLVWLDYSFLLTFRRLARRTVRRVITREELWNGNSESARSAFLSRDSIFVWLLKTYKKIRREYSILFSQSEYAHLNVVHLRSPREASKWLALLSTAKLDGQYRGTRVGQQGS